MTLTTTQKPKAPYLDFETPAALKVDRLRRFMETQPPADCPLVHRFTPGLYIREIFMPKGALVISKIHKTEHPFVISRGSVSVWDEASGITRLKAPHCGITKPGTRRVLYVWEDCVWLTFHPSNETNLEELEEQLIFKRTTTKPVEIDSEILRQLQEP